MSENFQNINISSTVEDILKAKDYFANQFYDAQIALKALKAENAELERKNAELEREIAKLKRKIASLNKEI